ncbi:hypothetical protein [Acidiphilium acidophilum]|uniref:hypothetical protein n=1 Tax=Acidiphilium acidophilum TaxID=76588 RepID=UPI002E8E69D9|nr:hypothetical protein [Acidiphilium acidophilum]
MAQTPRPFNLFTPEELRALQAKAAERAAAGVTKAAPKPGAPFNDGWGSMWRHAYSPRHFEQQFGYAKPGTEEED